MALVQFKKGTQAGYAGLSAKDANTLYFCTDTQRFYLGESEFTRPILQGAGAPTGTITSPVDTLYFDTTNSVLYIWKKGATAWEIAANKITLATVAGTGNAITAASLSASGVLTLTKGESFATAAELDSAVEALQADIDAKVASVTGEDAIEVDDTDATNPVVKLKIDETASAGNVEFSQGENGLSASVEIPEAAVKGVAEDEKVVSLDEDDLIQTTLSLNYDSTNKKIQLLGISDAVVAELDATAFIKDGMIKYAYYIDKTGKYVDPADGQEKTDTAHKNNLVIVFNDGGTSSADEKIYINLADLIDLYTAGNGIDVTSNVISVKIDNASEAFLTVSSAGLKLDGVQDAIDTAEQNAKDYTDDAIEALVNTDSAESGKYVSAVSQTDGVISVTRASLPTGSVTGSGVKFVKSAELTATGFSGTTQDADTSITDSAASIPTSAAVKSYVDGALTWGTF